MSPGGSQTVGALGEGGRRGEKQGRRLRGSLWEADNATVSQAVAWGHHLETCNIFFLC